MMPGRVFRWVVSALLLCVPLPSPAAIVLRDDGGTWVRLARPAQRIVALAPHATEMVFAVGAGAKLVGASAYSDYPPEARSIPRVGGGGGVDLERVVALHPDLVIGWLSGNHPGDVAALRRLGIPVFLTEPRTLSDIPRLLRAIGQLAGTERIADGEARSFDEGLQALEARYRSARPVTVFYEIWQDPLTTIGGEQIISQVIRLCGGRNIFSGLSALAPMVSIEAVVQADPQVIIASGTLYGGQGLWGYWRRFSALQAVRYGNLYTLDPDLIQRATPRLLEGARQMCGLLDEARRRELGRAGGKR